MSWIFTSPRTIARAAFVGLVAVLVAAVLTLSDVARSDSTPVGRLPAGPVSTTRTSPGQLVAVALPRARSSSGLVWRIARRFNARVVQQVGESNVGRNVVLVFKVVGAGQTSLVFALTRGDS